jgi:hypothetical protein
MVSLQQKGTPQMENVAKKSGSTNVVSGFIAAFAIAACRAVAMHHPDATPTTTSALPAGPGTIGPLAYSYDLIGDQMIIHAKGEIAVNEAEAFNAFRDTWKNRPGNIKRFTLALDSTGGSIAGAADMAEWVKANHVDTVVANGASCASACVLVWGAGVHKSVGVKGRIGVHNGSAINPNDKDRDAVADAATVYMTKAIASEGAPASVIAAAATTDASAIHWLDRSDVVAWKATVIDENGQAIVAK